MNLAFRCPNFLALEFRLFFKRNHLSYLKAHFSRRGKIDPIYVKIYLNKIARAVTVYGWNKIFNIDEMSIHINNSSVKTVAETGVENVTINCDRNEKEYFTFIGGCTLFQCLPLVIVSKGTTDKSKIIFQIGNSTPEIILSKNKNGWTNEEVFLKYLDYFADNISYRNECALILDCLSAHRTPTVLQKASELSIELIFVPANGTGLYQPLDRRIFGVLISKLRSIAGTEALSGKDRYSIVTSQLIDAWNSIKENERLLTSAWNIKGLFELVDYKLEHFGEGDDDDFIIDEVEEDEDECNREEEDEEDNADQLNEEDDYKEED